MLQSDEYREHLELFTSTTLAHSKIEDIEKILQSEEYKDHPELFTSEALARAKIEDISKLLSMLYWSDIRFKGLLSSTIVSKSKQMINKLPILISLAEEYGMDNCSKKWILKML